MKVVNLMGSIAKVFILACGLFFVGGVLYLLVKRKISERNSLLWLLCALIILTLSAIPDILGVIAHIIGIDYPPSLLFLLSTLILLYISLNQSIQISKISEQLKELTQNYAICRYACTKEKEKSCNTKENF